MTIQLGKTLIERSSVGRKLLAEELHRAQLSADARGRVLSLWEGRLRDPRGYWVPRFVLVAGTAPPPGTQVVANPRTGKRVKASERGEAWQDTDRVALV